MENIPNQLCPRCGRKELNIYYSSNADEKLGAWCQNCDLRAYFKGQELVSINCVDRLVEVANNA
jgi:transcription elongation factor Elf1